MITNHLPLRLTICVLAMLLLNSCGSGDSSYPIVYRYDGDVIRETILYTVDDSGGDVFPDSVSIFTSSGITPEQFFQNVSPPFPVSKIILNSKTEGTIEFDQNILAQPAADFVYSEDLDPLIPQLGIYSNEEGIFGLSCMGVNAQPQPFIAELRNDHCLHQDILEACKSSFDYRMYGVGDTLTYAIREFRFVEE